MNYAISRGMAVLAGMLLVAVCGTAQAEQVSSGMNGKCLDVPGGNTRQGVFLQMYDCNGSNAQRFERTQSGELRIGGHCVDAFGGRGQQGDRVGLWPCNGGANQKWIAANGRLVGMNNRCMDIANRNPLNGAAIILWDCNGGPNQSWRGMANNAGINADGQLIGVDPNLLRLMNIDPSRLKEAAALTPVAPLTAVAPLMIVSKMR